MKKSYTLFNQFRRITSGQAFIPEVDFLRFVAIFAVVIFHINGFIIIKNNNKLFLNNFFNSLASNGKLGVELFFVLSGFVLSIPFAKFYFGIQRTHPSLKRFYLRRIMRLEPPYIIVITLLLFMNIIYGNNSLLYLKSWAVSLIYMHNIIFKHTSFLTAVAWSLEIEVLFYLFFPLLAKFFYLKKTWRRALLVCLMVFIPLISYLYIHVNYRIILDYMQFFFMGMLLCDIYLNEAKIILNKYLCIALAVLFIYFIFFIDWSANKYLYIFLFPFLIGLFYFLVLSNADKVSLFRNNILVVIGGMCYTIYLIHYTIISLAGSVLIKNGVALINPYLIMVLLLLTVLIASIIFFKLVERPFMKSNWLESIKTINQKNKIPDAN